MYWELALSCIRSMSKLSWGHFKIEPIELNPEVPVNLVFIRKNRYIYYTHPHSFLCDKRKRESNIPTHTHPNKPRVNFISFLNTTADTVPSSTRQRMYTCFQNLCCSSSPVPFHLLDHTLYHTADRKYKKKVRKI